MYVSAYTYMNAVTINTKATNLKDNREGCVTTFREEIEWRNLVIASKKQDLRISVR